MDPLERASSKDHHVVIAGAGRVGRRTARLLEDHGHDAYLVEKDPKAFEEAGEALRSTVIEGDATDPSVLRQATPGGPQSLPP